MPNSKPTLFQIHASMTMLKPALYKIAPLWHAKDSILLLGVTATLADWLMACIDEINNDDKAEQRILEVDKIYVLQSDYEQLNNAAQSSFDQRVAQLPIQLIDDKQWVSVTQTVHRVVTIQS